MDQYNPWGLADGPNGDRIDEDLLAELFALLGKDGADGLVQVFDLFLAGVPTRLADAESALADGRVEDASRVAHGLRGSAGAFGARGLSRLADELERLCRKSDIAGSRALMAEIRAEFVCFRAILRERLPSDLPSV